MQSGRQGMERHDVTRGVAMIVAATLCLSTGGLIVRFIEEADGWQILFYRSSAAAATLLIFLLLRYREKLPAALLGIGLGGWLAALFLGIGAAMWVFSMLRATVAEVSFIQSTAPLFAALFGRAILRERVSSGTWIAMGFASFGMALMFYEGLARGELMGKVIALGLPLSFTGMIIAIRSTRTRDLAPSTCLGSLLAAGIGALMMENYSVTPGDLGLSLLLGAAQFAAGFQLMMLGMRHVPAAESSLLALLEVILAPVWVWLVLREMPDQMSMVGGLIVLLAVSIRHLVIVSETCRMSLQRFFAGRRAG